MGTFLFAASFPRTEASDEECTASAAESARGARHRGRRPPYRQRLKSPRGGLFFSSLVSWAVPPEALGAEKAKRSFSGPPNLSAAKSGGGGSQGGERGRFLRSRGGSLFFLSSSSSCFFPRRTAAFPRSLSRRIQPGSGSSLPRLAAGLKGARSPLESYSRPAPSLCVRERVRGTWEPRTEIFSPAVLVFGNLASREVASRARARPPLLPRRWEPRLATEGIGR